MTQASFQPQGYLRFDLNQGKVSTPDKRRHVVVPADLLHAAGQGDDLASAARRWGEEQGSFLVGLIRENILEIEPERFITELSHLMATLGWGWCELESWGGVLFVVIQQPPRGAAISILASFLAGVFSVASGQQFECVAIPDDGPFRFLLTGSDGVSVIRKWVDTGVSAGEVASRMQAGKHLLDRG